MDQALKRQYNIGRRLGRLRERTGMTQEEAARELQLRGLDVSRDILAKIETGRHHIPIPVLQAMKQIYRTSFEEMLEPEEPRKE